MTNSQDHREQLLSSLLQFLYPDARQDVSEEKRLLEEMGYDYDALSQEGVAFVRGLIRKEMARLAQERRRKLLTVLESMRHAKRVSGSLTETLKDILSEADSDLQLAFHKLEGLSETELESILADIRALKKIDDSAKSTEK
jgi:hypothetical protein